MAKTAAAADKTPHPPDPWLASLAPVFARGVPGPALDVACGRGQNTLWLAALGIEAHGVDVLPSAFGSAEEEAQGRSLPARFYPWDLECRGLPPGPWGAVLVFHYLDRALFPALEASLAPGGLLAHKTHLTHPLRGADAKPRNPSHLLRPGELLWSFSALAPIDYREWASFGEAYAALLARKQTSQSR